jgi:hypothetical protein
MSLAFERVLVVGGASFRDRARAKAIVRKFGSDLPGISITYVCAVARVPAGSMVVLTLSGGTALEEYADG